MAMVPETIMSGFKAAARCLSSQPQSNQISGEVLDISNTPTAVVARREGINYMPFLSSTGASPSLEKEDGRQFENKESDESPYHSEEAPSYMYVKTV